MAVRDRAILEAKCSPGVPVPANNEFAPQAEAAAALRDLIALDDARILGPAPLFRLQGRERSQFVVKAADRRTACPTS